MYKLIKVTDEVTKEILDFLYSDEIMNVFLIHYFENQRDHVGDVYVENDENKISGIVQVKYDGNSHFTTFYTTTENGLNGVASLVQTLNYDDILLAGKDEEVKHIMDRLGIDKEVYLNTYYKFNIKKYQPFELENGIGFREATRNNQDIEKIKEFLIGFFGAETEEAKQRITSDKKINEEMENGIYLLEINGETIGMARYFGRSDKYIDITTVYVDEQYRGKGYGKVLMQLMVKQAMDNNKIPITQTALSNKVAKYVYENMGFDSVCGYTFQFLK